MNTAAGGDKRKGVRAEEEKPQTEVIFPLASNGDARGQLHWELFTYAGKASYLMFDRDKRLLSGDWEDGDPDLVWKF